MNMHTSSPFRELQRCRINESREFIEADTIEGSRLQSNRIYSFIRLTDTEGSLYSSQSYLTYKWESRDPFTDSEECVWYVSSARESIPAPWDSSKRSGSRPWSQEHMLVEWKPNAHWLSLASWLGSISICRDLLAHTGLKVNPRERKQAGKLYAKHGISQLPLQHWFPLLFLVPPL